MTEEFVEYDPEKIYVAKEARITTHGPVHFLKPGEPLQYLGKAGFDLRLDENDETRHPIHMWRGEDVDGGLTLQMLPMVCVEPMAGQA